MFRLLVLKIVPGNLSPLYKGGFYLGCTECYSPPLHPKQWDSVHAFLPFIVVYQDTMLARSKEREKLIPHAADIGILVIREIKTLCQVRHILVWGLFPARS
jgi:hypothetical protein